jgi:DNA-binding MarR family transcriptional regulator
MSKQLLKECSTSIFEIYPIFRQTVYESFDKHSTKITRTQQAIVITMASAGTLSMSELARSIDTSNEQATRAVAQLVEKDFIVRSQNPQNRRVINISLTETAKNYLTEVYDEAAQLLCDKLSGISTANAKKLLDSLNTVSKLLNS